MSQSVSPTPVWVIKFAYVKLFSYIRTLIMAGIYIHIPFCRSRCIYCDFYSTTCLDVRDTYVGNLCREMDRRRNFLSGAEYSTVYIGGGTPSQLTVSQLSTLVSHLYEVFPISPSAEFTMEMNPDDVSEDYLEAIRTLPINRVSMGVQTFSDDRLRFLHRRHSSQQAIRAVGLCRKAGIRNISIDLMFGFPGETLEEWKDDVEKAVSLDVDHISAYSLMYEGGTRLTRMLEVGEVEEIPEELSREMYDYLCERLKEAGYIQYEISNFCRPGFHSRHNSSYWDSTPYIGIGAGAHSFDGRSREWNGEMENGEWKTEGKETLTHEQRYNELIMTGLRTSGGVSLKRLADDYSDCFVQVKGFYDSHLKEGNIVVDSNSESFRLTHKGIHISNTVMSDLMLS